MGSLPDLLSRLGRVIRTLRAQAGYSQERFGFAIGMHRTYMGQLERGTANPTMETLHSVALGLGVSILDLLTLALTEDSAEPIAAGIARTRQVPTQRGPCPGAPPERGRRPRR